MIYSNIHSQETSVNTGNIPDAFYKSIPTAFENGKQHSESNSLLHLLQEHLSHTNTAT